MNRPGSFQGMKATPFLFLILIRDFLYLSSP